MRSLTSLNEKWAKSVEHAEEKRKEPSRPFGQWELKKEILVEGKSK